VFVLGEDVARGGAYCATRGLHDRFGPERVRETPISEAAIVGVSVGAAMTCMRPVAGIMHMDFIACAMDQVVSQAAKIRYMSGGKAAAPIVIRCGVGGWLRGEVPEDRPTEQVLGQADVKRRGNDVTIVTWGAMVPRVLETAEALAGDGVAAEVVDLVTLWPWDVDAVLESVGRIGRAVVVHQAHRRSGFGAEVAATITERAWGTDRTGGPRGWSGCPGPIQSTPSRPSYCPTRGASPPPSDRLREGAVRGRMWW
jgi:acetoin:2,6-dichlorophenolindophenol oxidoreductase subunit beta